MTNEAKGTSIRKVWVPTEMKTAIETLCWQKRTRPSPFIVSIIEGFLADPDAYRGAEIPPAGRDYVSLYIDDSVWREATDTADSMGTRLSAVVRVGVARVLAEEGIPLEVHAARPRHERIPLSA